VRAKNHGHSDYLADIASISLPDSSVVTESESESESDSTERYAHYSPSAPVHLQHDARRPTACARLANRPDPDRARRSARHRPTADPLHSHERILAGAILFSYRNFLFSPEQLGLLRGNHIPTRADERHGPGHPDLRER
jgi:hypothetical protein